MIKLNFLKLNPLCIAGTPLPPNLLLMSKITVLGLLLKGYAQSLPKIFLPFLPFFDWLDEYMISGWRFQQMLEVIFVISAVMILLNVRARLSCFMLAMVIFTATLANQYYYSNNKIYCACMLLWAGLHISGARHFFLEWQIVLMYFGAGANKILEPDWLSGVYFDHWMKNIAHQPAYEFWASFLPPLMLGKLMGWMTIVTEFALSIGFLLRRLQPLSVWVGIVFHCGALILSGKDFQIYSIAILASYLTFIPWPKEVKVSYDAKSFFGKYLKPIAAQLDADRLFQWQEADGELSVSTGEKVYYGFAAFKMVLWFLPAHYFLLTALMCVPNEAFRVELVVGALLFYSPFIEMVQHVQSQRKASRQWT